MVEMPSDKEVQAIVSRRPANVTECIERIHELFHCMVGPPMAYLELPLAPVTTCFSDLGPDLVQPPIHRMVYELVGYEAPGSVAACERDLVARFMQPILAARILGLRILFWRRPPRLCAHHDNGRRFCRIDARLFIPGFDLKEFRAPWQPNDPSCSTTSSPATESTPTRK